MAVHCAYCQQQILPPAHNVGQCASDTIARLTTDLADTRREIARAVDAMERANGLRDRALIESAEEKNIIELQGEDLVQLQDQNDRLRAAVDWALGCNGDFRPREPGEGAYWWRKELKERTRALQPAAPAAPADPLAGIKTTVQTALDPAACYCNSHQHQRDDHPVQGCIVPGCECGTTR